MRHRLSSLAKRPKVIFFRHLTLQAFPFSLFMRCVWDCIARSAAETARPMMWHSKPLSFIKGFMAMTQWLIWYDPGSFSISSYIWSPMRETGKTSQEESNVAATHCLLGQPAPGEACTLGIRALHLSCCGNEKLWICNDLIWLVWVCICICINMFTLSRSWGSEECTGWKASINWNIWKFLLVLRQVPDKHHWLKARFHGIMDKMLFPVKKLPGPPQQTLELPHHHLHCLWQKKKTSATI